MRARFASSVVALALAGASAEAAVTAVWLGGTNSPVTIEALGTTLSHDEPSEGRYMIESSNEDVRFVRHVVSRKDQICYYWFRATEDPYVWTETEDYETVYWWAMEEPFFLDGAVAGDDNFVLLRNGDGVDLGVVQVRFTEVLEAGQPSPALILAYAVDPNGLSFADAVAAIQAIPEPSTTMLGALALAGGLMRRRRRDECAV